MRIEKKKDGRISSIFLSDKNIGQFYREEAEFNSMRVVLI